MRNKSKSDSSLKIDINYVARLANLPLSDEEKKTFEKQLKDVLNYIAKLNEINTDKVEPIAHIVDLANITRNDETRPSLNQDDALKNAPKTYNGFFEVDAIFDEQ